MKNNGDMAARDAEGQGLGALNDIATYTKQTRDVILRALTPGG